MRVTCIYRLDAAWTILVVVLVSGFCIAQSSEKAELLDSFGRIPSGDMRGRTDSLLTELTRQPNSSALVVLYGTPAEVVARKRYFQKHFDFRRFDISRISFRVGGNVSDVRTDFWIIPVGSRPPEIKPEAYIFTEFRRIYIRDAVTKIKEFFAEFERKWEYQAYIINYGDDRQIREREKLIANNIPRQPYDSPRITFVRGGNKGGQRSIFWLVPSGAAIPKP